MIPINGNLLTETFVMSMGILFLSLIIVRAFPIPLRIFQSVYLALGAGSVGVHYFFNDSVSILFPIVSLVAGIGLMFLCTGIFGKLNTSAHYEALLVAVGFYPWYLGIIESVIYVSLSVLFISAIYIIKQKRVTRKFGIVSKGFAKAESILSDKDFIIFNKIRNGIYTTPIGIAAIISLIYYSLTI